MKRLLFALLLFPVLAICQQAQIVGNITTGLKALSPATAVTIVSPSANTHAAYNINACYWYAP
jgi:hypothetical protein